MEIRINLSKIRLLPDANVVTLREVEVIDPDCAIVVCDFHIKDIEKIAAATPSGFKVGRITVIDHHAPVERMERMVSSTNLAVEYLRSNQLGDLGGYVVAINHIDCDSILSSGIMSGALPPDTAFEDAAIAADHTGAPNDIADLLQGIDAASRYGSRSIYPSFHALHQHIAGQPLGASATRALQFATRQESGR